MQIALSYFYTSLFCLAIALMLWLIGVSEALTESLVVSFSIGLSVNSAFVLLEPLLQPHLAPWLVPALVSAVGLAVGLLISGYWVSGRLGFFFLEHQASLILGVFFGVAGYLIFGTRARVMQLNAQLAETQAAQALAAQQMTETELRLLQAQIEPHFLFNTLSNVTSLIRTDPTSAEQMLENLSTLLRHSLKRSRRAVTTLGEELTMLNAYLAIQKIRMGNRLQYQFDVPAELQSLAMPPMLLQPLVENSVLHGIEPAETGGSIEVSASRSGTQLTCMVRDTGVGIGGQQGISDNNAGGTHSGTGLQNVRERLRALYQGQAQLEINETDPSGVTLLLRIPLAAPEAPLPKPTSSPGMESTQPSP